MSFLELDEFRDQGHLHKAVPKYIAEQEKKIPHPFWSLDRGNIDNLVAKISSTVKTVLQDFPGDDKELNQLNDAAVRLPQVDRSPAIKVALLGAQGAGKSLLINALFDYNGLSLTGASGGACTRSVVKYLFYPGEQSNFCAEVRFLGISKMTDMIKEHAKAYYDYYDSYDNPDDEVGHQNKNLQQEQVDLKLKNTAEEFFETLFGSKADFLESWDSRVYENGEFVSLSLLKYEDTLNQTKANENTMSIFGRDQYDLNKQLLPYLSKVRGEQCMWPLVDYVAVRITHPLLQHRIELIDLPGSGDTNASRTRHADEIKDSVDVVLILADTIRITTDEAFINRARGSVLTHGKDRVKLVATKIDVLSDSQVSQPSGHIYDELNQRISTVAEEFEIAEENDDPGQASLLGKYQVYLKRYQICCQIDERRRNISEAMTAMAKMWPTGEVPELFQISAESYMGWITKEKIPFSCQPALNPLQTGIPDIRRFLYDLPAQQNFKDIETHINIAIPTFIEKLKRAANHSERDAGFRNLADDFDKRAREIDMRELLRLTKNGFSAASTHSISQMRDGIAIYKARVDTLVEECWLQLKGQTFNKILKMGGTVPKGASKAVGLEEGCNWNFELASILAPGFREWTKGHTQYMETIRKGLQDLIIDLHKKTVKILDNSAANLLIVDKAKNKWRGYKNKLLVKVKTLLDQVSKLQKRFQLWATMETRQENNLVASITAGLYDAVFKSLPPLKESTLSKKPASSKYPRYTMPVIKYKKSELERLMIGKDIHFVNAAIESFKSQFDTNLETCLNTFFSETEALLENYSNWLRDQAPINYPITAVGKSIRNNLQEVIPELERQSQELISLFPERPKQEADEAQELKDYFGDIKSEKSMSDRLYSRGSRIERQHGSAGSKHSIQEPDSNAKRIKAELTS